jgi:hypothetical protein
MTFADLTPKELFDMQKLAYLKGDMGAVKDMASLAKSKLNFPNMEDWAKAKKILDQTSFPSETTGWKETRQESHVHKKNIHNLITYTKYIEPILNYEVEAKYNYCRECNQIRNKVLRMYNNYNNQCCEKYFVFYGKDATKQSLDEIVKSLFMVLVFVPLFIS